MHSCFDTKRMVNERVKNLDGQRPRLTTGCRRRCSAALCNAAEPNR